MCPYLQGVMPPLMVLASAKADIQLLDNDEDALEQEDGWELVPLKGKVIGIKTQTLEDKNTAIRTHYNLRSDSRKVFC